MKFQQINSTDADKVFVSIRNISAATVSAGIPVEWDAVTVTDGNAVTACKSGTLSLAGLFAGVTDTALSDSSYGLAQVYGFRTSAWVSAGTGDGGGTPGEFLKPIGSQLDHVTMSAATTSGHIFVSLMETVATSALAQRNIFIRAM